MKKLILFGLGMLLLTSTGYAQNTKEQRKEREAITKMSDKELKAKVSRDVKKQAKAFKKQGWQVNVGALSLEKQIEKAQRMQYEYNDDNSPKYFMGEMTAKAQSYAAAKAQALGEMTAKAQSYAAAKAQALAFAKEDLAGMIATEVTALVENTRANEQISATDAASIAKTVQAGKQLIAQRLTNVIPVVEVYRMDGKLYEVQTRIFYDRNIALQTAKQIVRQELEKDGKQLHKELDEIWGVK